MRDTLDMLEQVRSAWATVAAPSRQEMKYMERSWGKEAAAAFVGVRPVDVDVESVGFQSTTPLFELPPRAAAAYLGTYLVSLLFELHFQERVGLQTEVVIRAHTVTCLTQPPFWERVIRPHLSKDCLDAVVAVVALLIDKREAVPLTQDDVDVLLDMTGDLS
jgi:hypothetical protein